jgi:hypothetical protein
MIQSIRNPRELLQHAVTKTKRNKYHPGATHPTGIPISLQAIRKNIQQVYRLKEHELLEESGLRATRPVQVRRSPTAAAADHPVLLRVNATIP